MERTKKKNNFLGLSADEVAGLSIDEITNNEVAIKMLIHYYKQINDENSKMKNDINTLRTYVNAYDRSKNNTAIGTFLLTISNVCVGFGINLITTKDFMPGTFLMIIGIILIGTGFYFSYLKERQ